MLDPRTLLMAYTLEFFMLTITLGITMLQTRRAMRGPDLWFFHGLLYCIGTLLFGLREIAPDFVTYELGTAFTTAGSIAIPLGFAVFFGKKPRWWIAVTAMAVVMVVYAWFLHITPSTTARVIIFSGFGAIVYVYSAVNILRWTPPELARPSRIAVTFLALEAVLSIGRVVAYVVWSPGESIISGTSTDPFYYMASLVILPGVIFSELQLVNARLLADLARAASDKTLLMREMNHRVKNSLMLAESLVMLQRGDATDPAQERAMDTVRARLHSISLVHARLYSEGAGRTLRIDDYLQALTADLCENAGNVEFRNELEPLVLDASAAVPLGIITNELITNAIKYGAGSDGSTTISIVLARTAAGLATLRVADSGRGFSPDDKPGLGTTLIDSLAAQLGGSIRRSTGQGATVELSFPLTSDKAEALT